MWTKTQSSWLHTAGEVAKQMRITAAPHDTGQQDKIGNKQK
jgi:hypothetical protein